MWPAVCQDQTGNSGECVSSQSWASANPREHQQQADLDWQGRLSCPLPLLLTSPSLYPGVAWMGKRGSRRGNKEVNSSPPPTMSFSIWNSTKLSKKNGLNFSKVWASHFSYWNHTVLLWLEVTRVYFFNLRVSGKAKGISEISSKCRQRTSPQSGSDRECKNIVFIPHSSTFQHTIPFNIKLIHL